MILAEAGKERLDGLAGALPVLASLARRSRIGPIIRQGPHQGAQKSTTTGALWDCWMTFC